MSVLPVGFGSALGGYQIERSLRFDGSAYLNRTPASATNQKTWTWSAWVKRSVFGATKVLFDARGAGSNPVHAFYFNSSDQLAVFIRNASATVIGSYNTSAVFRDPSAWYHITYKFDSTQATATNRVQIYVNGVLQAITASTTISQNADAFINSAISHGIGAEGVTPTDEFDGYLTEVNFVDSPVLVGSTTNTSTTVTLTTGTTTNIGIGWNVGGTNIPSGATVSSITNSTQFVISSAATATGSSISIGVAPPVSAFGETDSATGVWKPKKYDGTYGTNGFYLKFADNSGTTSTTLGKDSSGNGNNWTPNGFSVTAGTGNDSLVDSPTSYGTDTGVGGEVRGNYATMNPLAMTGTYSNGNLNFTTAAADSTLISTIAVSSGKWYCEITPTAITANCQIGIVAATARNGFAPTNNNQHPSIVYASNTGNKFINGTGTAYGATYTTNDVIGIALDLDNLTLQFYKNGTGQGSITGVTSGTYCFAVGDGDSVNTWSGVSNFGQRPFEKWNGSAYVANTAPSGFKALCTQNLPTPTIGATSTTQANDYMNVVLYTGTGSSLGVTGVGFQPDWTWIKGRSGTTDHALYDAVRGVQKQLESNQTGAETTETTGLTAFNSDGFTVGALAQLNTNTATYVAWNWKANGAGSSNTAGSITSTVSANTTSGFSIVTYTGTGANATVGHGLGVTPAMIIVKNRDSGAIGGAVYHTSMGATKYLKLFQTTTGTDGETTDNTAWNGSSPTFNSNVFSVGSLNRTNSSQQMVAYCFAPVAGYSAFGSYTGNGAADGPFVYLGFRPAFVMVKNLTTAATSNWVMKDDLRAASYNPATGNLYANLNFAEDVTATVEIDLLSNGFKARGTYAGINGSGNSIIYAAFAENPFKYSLAR